MSSKRAKTTKKTDKASTGLRHFSVRVVAKLRELKKSTYAEISSLLLADHVKQFGPCDATSEKNVRRRVYDAINVLCALKVIVKEKKVIFWNGLPGEEPYYEKQQEKLKEEQNRTFAADMQAANKATAAAPAPSASSSSSSSNVAKGATRAKPQKIAKPAAKKRRRSARNNRDDDEDSDDPSSAWRAANGTQLTQKQVTVLQVARDRLDQKKTQLEELVLQFVAFQRLLERNNEEKMRQEEEENEEKEEALQRMNEKNKAPETMEEEEDDDHGEHQEKKEAQDEEENEGPKEEEDEGKPSSNKRRKLGADNQRQQRVHLPFILVNTSSDTNIVCELTEDRSRVHFTYEQPFEIHDDKVILRRLGELVPREKFRMYVSADVLRSVGLWYAAK